MPATKRSATKKQTATQTNQTVLAELQELSLEVLEQGMKIAKLRNPPTKKIIDPQAVTTDFQNLKTSLEQTITQIESNKPISDSFNLNDLKKKLKKLQQDLNFQEHQIYYQGKIDFYQQRLVNLTNENIAEPKQPIKSEDIKILHAFDVSMQQNIQRQKEAIQSIIVDYEQLQLLAHQESNPSKTQIENARNDKVFHLSQLVNAAQSIVTQREQYMGNLQARYAREHLELSQKKLLDTIANLVTNSELSRYTSLANIHAYLKTDSSFSHEKKLADLIVKARTRVSKPSFLTDGNSAEKDLQAFYSYLANMRFATQSEVDTSIKQFSAQFPQKPARQDATLFSQKNSTNPETSQDKSPTRKP